MTDESLRKRAEKIFSESLELPANERLEFVRERCGDEPALLEEVRSLLSSLENAATFLEPPTDTKRPIGFKPGDRIDRYSLIERLGEGGMGVVYLAQQHEPVHRRVALKVIKPGMDSEAVIRRFEAERQALAMMDHHHIARVLDAGATEAGLPYFVMELVRGMPITKFADRNNLGLKDRLRLFIEVCDAVQHAHQKGVIHRDLKPSNILVETLEGRPTPKIIDFGIAKALGASMSDRTMFTRHGQLIGTLEYMAPEQAGDNADTADTRADIYSLGVLLYELLTRSLPFESETLQKFGIAEFRKLIELVDPPKPSTRLSTGHTTTVDAPSTRPRTRTWAREVRGDLDWITMRALEKDRTRRYRSASELAEDIRRHLHNEPVSAGPPSVGYRAMKFVRRNRVGVGAAGAVAAALVLGLGLAVWQAQVAGAALESERAARLERDTHLATSLELATGMLDNVHDRVTALAASAEAEKAIVDEAMKYLTALEEESGDDPIVQRALAEGYEKLGQILEGSGSAGLGRTDAAIASFRKCRDIRLALFAQNPDDDDMRGQLWVVHEHLGRVLRRACMESESLSMLSEAMSHVTSLDPAQRGDLKELLRRASTLGELSETYLQLGRLEEAEKQARAAVSLAREAASRSPTPAVNRRFSVQLNTLAECLIETRQAAEATAVAEELIRIRESLLQGNRERGREPRDFYIAQLTMARALLAAGQAERALEVCGEAVQSVRFERQRDESQMDTRPSYDLAFSLLVQGQAQRAVGRARDSLVALQEAESIAILIANRDSGACRARQLLADVRDAIIDARAQVSTSSP